MKQTLVELVDAILQRIEDQPEGVQSESGLRKWLSRLGYSARDIDAAMKLVRPVMAPRPRIADMNPGAVRLLSAAEEYKLSQKARSALVRLELYELIEPAEREMLLDQLSHCEGEIGMAELEYYLSWVVCSTRDVESQQTIYHVLEGEGTTQH